MELKRKLIAASLGLSLGMALPAPNPTVAQTPTDIAAVMLICTPVIQEQYEGDYDRRGFCVNAVRYLLQTVGAPQDAANPIIADLVVALAELYELVQCPLYETELPEAIALAASYSTDPEQQAEILLISETIAACDQIVTAAVTLSASPF